MNVGPVNLHDWIDELCDVLDIETEVDEALDAARAETDEEARQTLYDQAVKQIVDDASYVYLYNPEVVQAWTDEVQGYEVRADRAIRFRDVSLSS